MSKNCWFISPCIILKRCYIVIRYNWMTKEIERQNGVPTQAPLCLFCSKLTKKEVIVTMLLHTKTQKNTINTAFLLYLSHPQISAEDGTWTHTTAIATRSLVLLVCQFRHFRISLWSFPSNAEGGIRTHAPLRTNGFQDRLVMTTSIPLLSAPPGARTPHTLIKSQVLYQMS